MLQWRRRYSQKGRFAVRGFTALEEEELFAGFQRERHVSWSVATKLFAILRIQLKNSCKSCGSSCVCCKAMLQQNSYLAAFCQVLFPHGIKNTYWMLYTRHNFSKVESRKVVDVPCNMNHLRKDEQCPAVAVSQHTHQAVRIPCNLRVGSLPAARAQTYCYAASIACMGISRHAKA